MLPLLKDGRGHSGLLYVLRGEGARSDRFTWKASDFSSGKERSYLTLTVTYGGAQKRYIHAHVYTDEEIET